MEAMEFESRRNVKAGDIFRAHLAATALSAGGGVPVIDEVITASTGVAMQTSATEAASATADTATAAGGGGGGGGLYWHEAPRRVPYHWGVSSSRAKTSLDGAENMDRLQSSVMDAIHDALSKEALIKKLIIPFNDSGFDSKHAVSMWEWQKNTALLELEHRNQQLQKQVSDASRQVLEAQARSQHDRKRLEEALQRLKEELHLITKAEALRNRVVNQMQVIARSRSLYTTMFSWCQFVEHCRKKRVLKKAALIWHRRNFLKRFDEFMMGSERIKKKRRLNFQARHHWSKCILEKCFQSWQTKSHLNKQLQNKVSRFVRKWTVFRSRIYFKGWQNFGSGVLWKQVQNKRACKVWSVKHLHKAWRQWHSAVCSSKNKVLESNHFLFERLVGDCVKGWLMVVAWKKHQNKESELSKEFRESRILQSAFETWYKKMNTSLVMRERLAHFQKRRKGRLQQVIMIRWHQLVLRRWNLKTLEKYLVVKVKTWCLRRVFMALRKRHESMKIIKRNCAKHLIKSRSAAFQSWRMRVQSWKTAKKKFDQKQKWTAHRRLQTSFSVWVLHTAVNRRSSVLEEAQKLAARVTVLETDLKGAERVQNETNKLVIELETGKTKLIKLAGTAMARNPVWTSGFLDVELRWTTPTNPWLPRARAGHSAVSLPGSSGSNVFSRVVIFGGFNGTEYFNDVLVYETDVLQWKEPVMSVADGCVIPPPMHTHTACAFGRDKMVVFGGFDGAKEFSEVFVMYLSENSLSCEWSQPIIMAGAQPGPRCQHTSCLYKNGPHMVVFGGYRSSVGLLNDLWILDLHWMLWTSPECFGTPPVARRGHGAAVVGNKLYVFGGYNGRDHLDDLHAIDLDSRTWESFELRGPVPSPRRQHSIAVVGQHLVLHGGFDGQEYLGDVFSFHTEHKKWTEWLVRENRLALAETGRGGEIYGRSMHTMVEAGQRLIVFGGVHALGASQDIFFLENAAAIDGLQLQTSLLEELEKARNLQLKAAESEEALREKTTELARTHVALEELRTTLKVEAEKRRKAVQGHSILTKKLQKARTISDSLSQICNRLRNEVEHLRSQYKRHMTSPREGPPPT